MYRGDGDILEEMSDEVERPLTGGIRVEEVF